MHLEELPSKKVGRPSQGITRKVSLTLTAEEWAEIDTSGLTVAAFLKEKMNQNSESVPARSEEKHLAVPVASEATEYHRRHVEEHWARYLENPNQDLPSAEIIEDAKVGMFRILFPKNAETAVVQKHLQFLCPFTGKRFGSMDKLVRAAIPYLLEQQSGIVQRQIELDKIQKLKEQPRYFID